MSIGVKICGVTTEAAIDACIEAEVDWVGFVFFERSPRHLSAARAAALARRLPATILPVGLFVRPVAAAIAHVLADVPLAALQVYDTPSRIAAIRAGFSPEVWEARPLAPGEAPPDATPGHRLVIEARAPDGSDRPGGTGTSLEWSALLGWAPPASWLLAGGLAPENVAAAIRASGAAAVDVSSGVESAPGVKDPAAIRAFVRAARAALADQ